MLRRKFIKHTMAGLPIAASFLSDACSPKERIDPKTKSVIVVGAGISGLAAARQLHEQGFTVIVLEAQDRVGGRLRTNRSASVAFDEGASWIHGIDGNPITALAQQAGMQTAWTDDESRKSYDLGGIVRKAAVYDAAEEELYTILDSLMKRGSSSQSFETVFRAAYPAKTGDRLWTFFLSNYLTFDTGDLNNLSSLLYNEGEEYAGVERIAVNGYDTIPAYLANGLPVLLNQRVTAIDYRTSTVQVTHNGTVSEADFVIVTVPLGVLKANRIAFTPLLPAAKQEAIRSIGMNCVNKFLLIWDKAFWDDVQYISYTPDVRDKFNYFVNVRKYQPALNALMTFAYAGYGRQTETMTDQQVIAAIMAHLRDIYGNAIPEPVTMLRTKWQTNEFTLGAYSYTAVDTRMSHFDDLAESVGDRLFFAGEHTHIDYFSTAHGAWLSGLREAGKIMDLP